MSASLPEVFPLHENRPFLSEREWTCLRLICHTEDSIADCAPDELALATGGQIDARRAGQLVAIARMARLPGLGSWMTRLLVEAGVREHDLTEQPADALLARVNAQAGYPICNAATVAAFALLQASWRQTAGTRAH